jgi:hypothetical protein
MMQASMAEDKNAQRRLKCVTPREKRGCLGHKGWYERRHADKMVYLWQPRRQELIWENGACREVN